MSTTKKELTPTSPTGDFGADPHVEADERPGIAPPAPARKGAPEFPPTIEKPIDPRPLRVRFAEKKGGRDA